MDINLHRIDAPCPVGDSFVFEMFGACEHGGELRSKILGLKYGHDTALAREIGALVAAAMERGAPGADRVTWAPTTRGRVQARGFDQAELIARHASAFAGIPFQRTLRRVNEGSQTRSTRAERLERPRFVARPGLRGHLVVVDDVVTTGATFVAASRALAAAGATRVTCIAAAWAPDPRRTVSAKRGR